MALRLLVSLDKEDGRFFGGEPVEGTVAVSAARPTSLRGVEVRLVRNDCGRAATLALVWVPAPSLLRPGDAPLVVPFSVPTRGDACGSYADARRAVRFAVVAAVRRRSAPFSSAASSRAEREIVLVPLVDADAAAGPAPLHAAARAQRRTLGVFRRGSVSATCDVARGAVVAGERVVVAGVGVANNATDATTVGEVSVRLVEAVVRRRGEKRVQERTLADTGNVLPAPLGFGGTFNGAAELALPAEGVNPSLHGEGFAVEHFVEVHVRSPGGRRTLLVLRCRYTVATTRGLPPGVRPRSVSSPISLADVAAAGCAGAGAGAVAAVPKGACVVCQDSAATHAVVPCGHRCLCDRCAASIRGPQCPICRRPLTSIIRVYDP